MVRGRRLRPRDPERLAPLVVALVAALLLAWWLGRRDAGPPRTRPAVPEGQVLLCAWNVENLFDDEDDPKFRDPIEDWFGRDRRAQRAKVLLVADAVLAQNGGRGPDLLALVEVESLRAVELLRDELNSRLPERWRYRYVVHRDNRTGRRIEPALISRLPAEEDTTRDYGIRRVLAARVGPADAPLLVLVSHWTSRATDEAGAKRLAYARAVYRGFLDHYRDDPGVDLLVVGDFNDEPGDPSLREGLRATDDPARVRAGDARPYLLDLGGGLRPRDRATYYYQRRWEALDHLVASPGLLGPPGWRVVPGSFAVLSDDRALRQGPEGRPRRFGGPDSGERRGPSDHFAVTVRLTR